MLLRYYNVVLARETRYACRERLTSLIYLVFRYDSQIAMAWSVISTTVYLTDQLTTNQLTPFSTDLPENLTVSQLVKKFPAFYGTARFITAFTTTHHLSLYSARSIQSMPSHPFLKIRFNIILPSIPWSCKWCLSLRSPHHNPIRTSPVSHTFHMPRPSQCSWFDHPNNIAWAVQQCESWCSSLCSLLHCRVISFLLGPSIFLITLLSSSSFSVRGQVSHPCKTTGKITSLYILNS